MLIATFGPTTAWVGKSITYDGGVFTLEGHGVITAADVLSYDRQGQISWAAGSMRDWVQHLASGSATTPAARPQTAAPLDRTGRAFFGLSLGMVLGGAAILIVVALVIGFVVKSSLDEKNRVALVREGVESIYAGLSNWSVDHNQTLPDPSIVNSKGLAEYVRPWPTNPYTNKPMEQGTDPGDPGDFWYRGSTAGGTVWGWVRGGKKVY